MTNTDARNKLDGLTALANRMFDNRLAIIDCDGGGCSLTANVDLDASAGVPVPTPYGIAADANGQVLVVSVAGSDGQPGIPSDAGTDIPRAHHAGRGRERARCGPDGRHSAGRRPRVRCGRRRGDGLRPEHGRLDVVRGRRVDACRAGGREHDPGGLGPDVRRSPGRGASRSARRGRRRAAPSRASPATRTPTSTKILWTINTDLAPGDPCGGADVCPEPRSTMPIRGLRDTLPLHWAGNLADPFPGLGVGGPEDPVAPDCDIAVVGENGCIRHLVDASLSGVMCDPGSCPVGPAGLPGALTDQERDDMAAFMGAVSFPPSPTRRPTDVLSASALQGADDFFTDQGWQPPRHMRRQHVRLPLASADGEHQLVDRWRLRRTLHPRPVGPLDHLLERPHELRRAADCPGLRPEAGRGCPSSARSRPRSPPSSRSATTFRSTTSGPSSTR